MQRRRFSGLALLGLLLIACGRAPARVPTAEKPIDALRKSAERAPKDPALWTELAIAEHLQDGGDPERARAALTRAKQLGAKNLRLSFVEAEQYVLEGHPAAAFDALASVLRGAGRSEDPLSPLLAEAALSGLVDMNDAIDDYRPRLSALFAEVRPEADALGLTAAHQLRMQLLAQSLSQGQLADAEKTAREAGCVQKAEVAGAFGPRELLGFEQPLPGEDKGALAPEYDLGVGRGKAKTRTLETHRCLLGLGRGAHDALAGTSLVRAELEVAEDGDYVLRFESPNSMVLWLDGSELARLDLRTQPPAGVHFVPVTLKKGKHELRLKVSSRHPNPVVALTLVKGDSRAIERVTLPDPSDSFSRFLTAKLALARGNGVGARELIRRVQQTEPTAHWLVLQAATALADPLRPGELRRDAARDLLRKAMRRDPEAWYPTLGLANLEAAEGRLKEAIEALRQAQARWPEVVAIRTSLIEHLRERGFNEEAEMRTAELERVMPNACAVTNIALAAARTRGRMDEIERLTERNMACDATSTARFVLLKARRQYTAAAQELLRVRGLADPMDRSQRNESELEEALIAGDVARARQLREERTQIWADRPGPVLDGADMLLSAGKKQPAVDYLGSSIQKHPNELYELRRVHEALGGEALFEGFRKNGADVISAFEKAGKSYAEPQVLLLDYTVVRVFEDGSSVDLTHNIIRVQSQEAVDDNGEFSVPDGARLLTLHTVKADGTRLEPDAIAGKSSLSLPNLAPGDYMEFEMVRGESPSMGFPGGYLGNRFYFKSFEVPFDHSELVVILPASMEPVIDPRGPAPKTVRQTRDGLTVLRWAVDESRPLSQEPRSVSSREFLPSVNLGVKVSWEAYLESLRDLLADKDIVDPAAVQAVDELLGGDRNAAPSVRAAKIYRWVTDQIEPTEEVFGLSAAMLAARTGHRERVLKYMLDLAGIPSDLVLVRGVEADHSEARLPDLETFGYLLLRAQTERGPVWLHAGARHAPFGYLPQQVRGENGFVLNATGERVTLPPNDLEQDLRSVEAEFVVSASGSATIHVRETHRGTSAVGWRNDLDEIPMADLEARFEEGYASNVIPGARLKALKLANREDPEQPLVVDYQLEVDSLGQRTDHELRIPAFMPSSLVGQFGRQGVRTTTEIVAPAQVVDVVEKLTLPAGAKVLHAPAPANFAHPMKSRFEASTQVQGNQVTLRRSLRMPIGRVTPDAYAGFAQYCRAVDLAEAAELVIQLP